MGILSLFNMFSHYVRTESAYQEYNQSYVVYIGSYTCRASTSSLLLAKSLALLDQFEGRTSSTGLSSFLKYEAN